MYERDPLLIFGGTTGGRLRDAYAEPAINVVYTINEPAAVGAAAVLRAAGSPAGRRPRLGRRWLPRHP
jgi:hypothetical protein